MFLFRGYSKSEMRDIDVTITIKDSFIVGWHEFIGTLYRCAHWSGSTWKRTVFFVVYFSMDMCSWLVCHRRSIKNQIKSRLYLKYFIGFLQLILTIQAVLYRYIAMYHNHGHILHSWLRKRYER